jgi:hypothetical protein
MACFWSAIENSTRKSARSLANTVGVPPAGVGTLGDAGAGGGLLWGEAGEVTQQYAMAGILRDDRLAEPGTRLEKGSL